MGILAGFGAVPCGLFGEGVQVAVSEGLVEVPVSVAAGQLRAVEDLLFPHSFVGCPNWRGGFV